MTTAVTLFGGFRVLRNGTPVVFRTQKAQALLAHLAATPGPVARREAARLLWFEMPAERALANLRVTLNEIRSILPDHFRVTRTEIALDPDIPWEIDVAAFAAGADSMAGLEAAVARYEGAFLAGFTVERAPLFDEWKLDRQQEFEKAAIAYMEELADRRMGEEAWEPTLLILSRLTQLQPWHEKAWRLRMEALVRSGQRDVALAEFRGLRDWLASELGTSPERETVTLAEWISREGHHADELRARITHPPTPLFGRDGEVDTIERLVREEGCRLITVSGPGGVGKTRLARETAWRTTARGTIPVAIVELASVHSVDSVPAEIAQQLGKPLVGLRPSLEELADLIGNEEQMLVLDNLEHLFPGIANVVSTLHDNCPRLTLITTSRTRLRLHVERVIPLRPFEIPSRDTDPRTFSANPAVQIFVEQARAVGGGDSFDNLASIAQICRAVDGLPLAIELVAARTRLISPEEILIKIGTLLSDASTAEHDRPERHTSLRRSLEWSYALLSKEAKSALRSLGYFAGGAPLGALAMVAPVPEPAFASAVLELIEANLIERITAPGGTHLALLESTRSFALEELEVSGELERVSERHTRTFLQFVEVADTKLRGPHQVEWYTRFDTELDNVRTALARTLEKNDPEPALRLAKASFWYCNIRGLIHEGRDWLLRAIKLAEVCESSESGDLASLAGHVRLGIVFMNVRLGEKVGLIEMIERAEQDFTTAGNQIGLALCNFHRAFMALNAPAPQMHVYPIFATLEDGVALTEAGVPATGTSAEAGASTKTIEPAIELLRRTITTFDVHREKWESARCRNLLGNLLIAQGDITGALREIKQARHLYVDIGDWRGIALAEALEGACAGLTGDIARARSLIQGAIEKQRFVGDDVQACYALRALGGTYALAGNNRSAARLFGAADAVRERAGLRFFRSFDAVLQMLETRAREALTPEEWDEEWRTGQAAGLDVK